MSGSPTGGVSRTRVDQLRREQTSLQDELTSLRERIERLEAARDRLRQVAVVRIGRRRAIVALALLAAATAALVVLGVVTRHTTIVACARAGAAEPWAMGPDLEKLARMLGHAPEAPVDGPGPCVTLPLDRVVSVEERGTITAQLQRLTSTKLPKARARFSLVVTERRAPILDAIRMEPGDPRVYPLTPVLRSGGEVFRSYDRPSEDLCVWSIPVRSNLPRLWYLRDFLIDGPKAKHRPFDQAPLALHHVSTDSVFFQNLAPRMKLYQRPPYDMGPPSVATESSLQIVLETKKNRKGSSIELDRLECARLPLREDDAFFAGLVLPVLGEELVTFRFEEASF